LPAGAVAVVTIGGILAVATSLNATMLVPPRLWLVLARDGLLPRWLGMVHADRGTPTPGLAVCLVIAALLLVSGQMSLALNIAVFALVLVYGLHSLALLLLPSRNPELYRQVTVNISPGWQRAAAVLSLAGMGTLVIVQVIQDVGHIGATSLGERLSEQSLTSLELLVLWGGVGLLLYQRVGRTA
ncbi:MAG: APC family permease, partial [Deltaproteobacteria bacterium]|nr:APC family permease [Deltaproteobacteria bacterium]